MGSNWQTIILGDVCTKIGSGATPRGGQSVYLDQGEISLIRSQNVYNEGFHHDGLTYIIEEHADQLSGVVVEPNDILLNITGDSVARCCLVDNDVIPARVNQHVAIIRPDPRLLDPRYLRYFLISPIMQSKMLSWAGSGGTRNALTKGMIESFEIPAPPLPEQRAIAAVLGALDDKIELNRRMNGTLEAMARALFKSWFVDFDPVRAKMGHRNAGTAGAGLVPAPDNDPTPEEGNHKGLPQPPDIAALFPDEMEVGEDGGERPLGWGVVSLGELFSLGREIINPGAFPEELFEHYSIPAFDNGRMPKVELGSSIKSNKLQVSNSSILLSRLNPATPRIWLPMPMKVYRALCSTEFAVVEPKNKTLEPYLYGMFDSNKFQSVFIGLVTGTSGSHQRVKPDSLLAMSAVLPHPRMLETFARIVQPMHERMKANLIQSATLSALRDALLPKLMSGEVRVSHAENMFGVI